MDKGVIEIIEKYKKALTEMGVNVSKIILYGSHAKGKASPESDIDIIVISNDFKTLNLRERLELLAVARLKAGIFQPMEILGYTEEEFESMGPGTFIGDEVKPVGIEL